MTKQKTPPDVEELLHVADQYLAHVIRFFKGMQEQIEKVEKPDPTWATATDDVKTESEPQPEDVFDLYIEQLERRAYEHSKRGEINATAAIRRIINELRALDTLDS